MSGHMLCCKNGVILICVYMVCYCVWCVYMCELMGPLEGGACVCHSRKLQCDITDQPSDQVYHIQSSGC